MNPLHVWAIAVLMGSPDFDEPFPAEPDLGAAQAALKEVAVEIEILDEREKTYFFLGPKEEDWHNDVRLLRNRYKELKDCPRLASADNFIWGRTEISELTNFNRQYYKVLEKQSLNNPDRYDLFKLALKDTNMLYQTWDALRDSKCHFYYTVVKRQALKRLKDTIGEEDFLAGRMPDHVPVWTFREQ